MEHGSTSVYELMKRLEVSDLGVPLPSAEACVSGLAAKTGPIDVMRLARCLSSLTGVAADKKRVALNDVREILEGVNREHALLLQLRSAQVLALAAAKEMAEAGAALEGLAASTWSICRAAGSETSEEIRLLIASATARWFHATLIRPSEEESYFEDVANVLNDIEASSLHPMFQALHGKIGMLYDQVDWLVAARQAEIATLWWDRAGWSPSTRKSWDEIEPSQRAVVMTLDFAKVAPASEAALSLLLRALKAEGIDMAVLSPVKHWAKVTQEALVASAATVDALPAEVTQLLKSDATGYPALGSRLGASFDHADVTITAREWWRMYAREHVFIQHQFKAK